MEEVVLQCKDIRKSFGGLQALKGVNIEVKENSITAIIGPNGAGKTTLLNIISGLLFQDSGDVLFRGRSISGMPAYKRNRLGIVRTFQNLEIFTNMTVLDNVLTGAHQRANYGLLGALIKSPSYRKAEALLRQEAMKALEFVGLTDVSDRMASELPFGLQRLTELARALASGADILLLDEPAAGLNMRETRQLAIVINRIKEKLGKTVLLVEHDMDLVMHISDWVVVLDFGEKIAEGTPFEVQKDQRVKEAYLGQEDGESA
jgi:branched-chain amino acid transport system ATP-binding protein